MKKYRLKKEAVQYFKDSLATSIEYLNDWNKIGVDLKALEEVEEPYITFGHKDLSNKSATLSGWNEKGSHFHFSIIFPSVKFHEHDKFSKGRNTRELMNKIQYQIDNFYDNFTIDND